MESERKSETKEREERARDWERTRSRVRFDKPLAFFAGGEKERSGEEGKRDGTRSCEEEDACHMRRRIYVVFLEDICLSLIHI